MDQFDKLQEEMNNKYLNKQISKITKFLFSFYNNLVEEGFGKDQALKLTLNYQTYLLNNRKGDKYED